MLNKSLFTFFFIYISVLISASNGDRIKDTMYVKINGSVACYRRMNATHQIGCSSDRGGSVGIIHVCDIQLDVDFVLNNASAGRYIPIISTSLFTKVFEKLLSSHSKIAGLILHKGDGVPREFSHDKKCPNNQFSVEGTCPINEGWNPWGTGLLFRDIPFPMFYIEDEQQIKTIKDCFQKFNNFSFDTQSERSLCSLELNSFMYATTNTPTCRRRSNIQTNLNPVKFCDPLGDNNIFSFLFPLVEGQEPNTKPIKDFKYIVVAARADTTSLFDTTAGADNPITGVVTLLTTAKLLKDMLPSKPENMKKNVLFLLFNGETYDYIGSQRMLYDMERGLFPSELPPDNSILPAIYPSNISLFIELSQLANGDATYAHYLENSDVVTNFVKTLHNNIPSNRTFNVVNNSLPPSSLHTFIRSNTTVKGLLLANHKTVFHNHYYNSLYDNASNIAFVYHNGSEIGANTVQKYVGDVAIMVAKSVYEELNDRSYSGEVKVDLSLIDEMFHCYLENADCKFHKALTKADLPKHTFSLYVGVDIVNNFFGSLVTLALGWVTGDVVGPAGPNCTNLDKELVFLYYNMSSNLDNPDDLKCYRTTANVSEAISPAFLIKDYDWSSNKYSSWSESTWNDMKMRMFLKPSAAHERMTLAVGTIVMILSFLVVYFVKSRSQILFDLPILTDPPADC